jgi:hypothetical protein
MKKQGSIIVTGWESQAKAANVSFGYNGEFFAGRTLECSNLLFLKRFLNFLNIYRPAGDIPDKSKECKCSPRRRAAVVKISKLNFNRFAP